MRLRHNSAFTIIETAVVLAIIALLAGAILVGKELQTAAVLRQVIREVATVTTAINAFRQKYNAWPGDLPDASAYWGSVTEDGNGDGRILINTFGGGEQMRLWQQLALAGLIPGEYTGEPGAWCLEAVYSPGRNVPASAYGREGGLVLWDNAGAPLRIEGRHPDAKYLLLGARLDATVCTWAFVAGLLQPAEGRTIDRKLDDGIAFSGTVLGLTGTTRQLTWFPELGCGSPVLDPPVDDYQETAASGLCLMLFRIE